MNGRRYYFTTIGAWRRHAARCAETHFVAVNAPAEQNGHRSIASQEAEATDACNGVSDQYTQIEACATKEATNDRSDVAVDYTQAKGRPGEQPCVTDDTTPILALIGADEGAHLAMEDDAEFETLPHPLTRTPVSQHVTDALVRFGVVRGDDTFTVAEKLAGVNPLLRHRVF
jgi:hypothetical protein